MKQALYFAFSRSPDRRFRSGQALIAISKKCEEHAMKSRTLGMPSRWLPRVIPLWSQGLPTLRISPLASA
jgi:hypothetical protein